MNSYHSFDRYRNYAGGSGSAATYTSSDRSFHRQICLPKLKVGIPKQLSKPVESLGNSKTAQLFLAANSSIIPSPFPAPLPHLAQMDPEYRRQVQKRYFIEEMQHSGDDGWADYLHWYANHGEDGQLHPTEPCACPGYEPVIVETPEIDRLISQDDNGPCILPSGYVSFPRPEWSESSSSRTPPLWMRLFLSLFWTYLIAVVAGVLEKLLEKLRGWVTR